MLLDLADSAELRSLAGKYSGVGVVTAKAADGGSLSGLLARPDGCVAWAAEDGDLTGLGDALNRWFVRA